MDEIFTCPLCNQIMREPVVCSDGHSYERSAMQAYSDEGHRESPKNPGEILAENPDGGIMMLSNTVIKGIIDALRASGEL